MATNLKVRKFSMPKFKVAHSGGSPHKRIKVSFKKTSPKTRNSVRKIPSVSVKKLPMGKMPKAINLQGVKKLVSKEYTKL